MGSMMNGGGFAVRGRAPLVILLAAMLALAIHMAEILAADAGLSQDAETFLALHNEARAAVGVADLRWDGQLESYARAYSPTCALIHSGGRYGENLFIGSGGREWGAEDAVGMWVAERESYHYESNTCDIGQQCGHYTQVVWRGTTSVGCATAHCGDGSTFIICSYDPPGNYVDERPY